ncbi:MAG: hypothetical protein Q9216_003942 [Gyalolechia sp. 2 TL-2023]
MSDSSDNDDADRKLFMGNLAYSISKVHSAGSFAAFGVIDAFVNPGISVEPIGIVRLPLSQEDANSLVQASQKAPFGKGNQTLVDESVRKTWQIDAEKIQYLNSGWQRCLDQTVERVAQELGVAGGSTNVRAEFYKMLLYEPGAMFKPHQDTEKVPGMFGTLVICLPSSHTGGAVSLRHGAKSKTFDTSTTSTFDASFVAWYADVTHEIEAVQTGYRWVLTYNLVNTSHIPYQSASALDVQIEQFAQALTQWQDLEDAPEYLAYPLAHQYTNQNLRLAQLKGDDYHRARHVAQGCAAHGKFYVLLANMEMCMTDRNCEEEEEVESQLILCRVVDLQGSNLSMYNAMNISDEFILHGSSYDDRQPDVQRGGNYLGNQYAEIEQFFKDSALVIVPSNCMHEGRQDRDLYLGPAAVNAAFLEDVSLFSKTVKKAAGTFEKEYYCALGEFINIQKPVVQEHDIIEALTKSGKLSKIHENLNAFRDGFFRGNCDRSEQVHIRHFKRWIDNLTCGCLRNSESVCEEDASALINILLDREEEPFSQFVLYQGVRTFIDYFRGEETLISALMIELSLLLQYQGRSKIYLETILRNVAELAVCKFNLSRYATYVKSRPASVTRASGRKSCGQAENVIQCSPGGPIKAFYEYISNLKPGASSQLLRKIQTQAAGLTLQQAQDFVPSFLTEMLIVVDVSSAEAQECLQTLIEFYIVQTVGQEPEKPSNWARPQEMERKCYVHCYECSKMEEFLRDPQRQHYTLPSNYYHLSSICHHFEYFDVEKNIRERPIAVMKTTKWWEEQHQKWESRASTARKALQRLSKAKLKGCLGHRYDEMMDFQMLKVNDKAHESNAGGKDYHQVGSTVPQKRSGDVL